MNKWELVMHEASRLKLKKKITKPTVVYKKYLDDVIKAGYRYKDKGRYVVVLPEED